MKSRLIYVELKSGHSDNGPAWIGVASTSKSGAALYSNGKAFKSLKGSGISANYFDIETGEQYWISGVKKNNQDRHWAGRGNIAIERSAVSHYLQETGRASLPRNLIPSDLAPSQQLPHHGEREHRLFADRDDAARKTVPMSRRDVIKQKI